MRGPTTEAREGWFLLSVETEMNGRSKSTNEKGLSWLFRWTRRTGTRDFYPALAALVSPAQTSFFLTVYYFNFVSPSPSNLGRKSCTAACL
jgi:hypothetical protein